MLGALAFGIGCFFLVVVALRRFTGVRPCVSRMQYWLFSCGNLQVYGHAQCVGIWYLLLFSCSNCTSMLGPLAFGIGCSNCTLVVVGFLLQLHS